MQSTEATNEETTTSPRARKSLNDLSIEELRSHCKEFYGKLRVVEEEYRKLKAINQGLESDLQNARAGNNQTNHEDGDNHGDTVRQLQNELQAKDQKLQGLLKNTQELVVRYKASQARVQQLEAAATAATEVEAATAATPSNADVEVEALTAETTALKQKLEQLHHDYQAQQDTYNATIHDLEAQLAGAASTSQQASKHLEAKIAELEAQAEAEGKAHQEAFGTATNESADQIAALQARLLETQTANHALMTEKAQLASQLESALQANDQQIALRQQRLEHEEQTARLTQELGEVREQIEQSTAHVSSLQDQLDVKQEDIRQLTSELEATKSAQHHGELMKGKYDELLVELDNAKQYVQAEIEKSQLASKTLSAKQREYDELKQSYDEQSSTLQSLQSSNDEMSSRVTELSDRCDSLSQQLQSKEAGMSESVDVAASLENKQREYDELKQSYDEQSSTLQSLQSSNDEMSSRVTELSDRCDSLSQQLQSKEAAMSESVDVAASLENKQREYDELKQSYDEQSSTLQSLQSSNDEMSSRVTELSDRCDSLSQQLQSKEAAMSESVDVAASLENKEEECVKLAAELAGKNQQLEQTAREFVALKEALKSLEEESQRVRSGYEDVSSQFAQLQEQHQSCGEIEAEYKSKLEQMETELTSQAEQHELLNCKHGQLVTKAKELFEQNKALAADKETLGTTINRLQCQIEELQSADASKDEMSRRLEIQLEEAKANVVRITELEKQVTKSEVELKALQAEHANAIHECVNHNQELHTRAERIAELEQVIRAHEDTIEAMSQEYEQALVRNEEGAEKTNTQAEEIEKLREQLKNAESRVVEVSQSIEDRDAQIFSFDDHIASLAEKARLLQDEKVVLADKLAQATATLQTHFQVNMLRPGSFRVVVRVTYADDIWCLIQYHNINLASDDGDDEDGQSREADIVKQLDWAKEDDLLSWIIESHRAAHPGEADDLQLVERIKATLPRTLQEECQHELASLKSDMSQKMGNLKEELEQSSLAFSAYRTRAHTALKKTAQEQQVAEAKIKTIQTELQEQQQRARKAEARLKSIDQNRKEKLQQLTNALGQERAQSIELRKELQLISSDLHELKAQYAQEAVKAVEQENRMQLQEQIVQLEAQNQKLTAELDRLRKELKNRGDLARKLLAEKDDELRRMRDRLRTPADTANKSPKANYNTFTSSPRSATTPVSIESQSQHNGDDDTDAEHNIIALAKLQAQREEETTRLRRQIQQTTLDLTQAQELVHNQKQELQTLSNQLAHLKHEREGASQLSDSEIDGALQDRLTYLKSAFVGFFRARTSAEKAALGRVIGTILGFTEDEQQAVLSATQPLAQLPLSFAGLFG